MSLPKPYTWLNDLAPPRVLREALKLYGTQEQAGMGNNPVILQWAAETGLAGTYRADEIPWCGLFAAVVVKRAGYAVVAGPLWARNWVKFGNPSPEPGLGDVLAFERGTSGHVGFYVAEDAEAFHVLGGNQGDSVSIIRVGKDRLLQARRCPWVKAQPESVKPYHVAASGTLSTDEA